MGFLEGARVGGMTPNQRGREIELHDSNMATADAGRESSRLDQLETLQKLRTGDATHSDYMKNAELRDEKRAAGILQTRNAGLQAQQDSEARQEVDSVSRLRMAHNTNNEAMWNATLDEMDPGTRAALEGIPMEQVPSILEQMNQVATQNLDQLRKRDIIGAEGRAKEGVAAATGRQARMTGQQHDMNTRVTQQEADANANKRANVAAGAPGMIANQALDDPEAAKAKEDAYIEASVGALNRKGMGTPKTRQEINAAYDKSVTSGMEATAASMITEYTNSGVDISDIGDAEDLSAVPGWAAMRTSANKWVKLGASGSDVHDLLVGRYLLVDKDKGFIEMPMNAIGEAVGDKTALDLMKEARDTGEDIDTIVRRHARRVKHTHGITWKHGL